MRFIDWLKPGIKLKRWFFLSAIGVWCISLGFSVILKGIFHSYTEYALSGFLIISGIIFIWLSVKYIMHTIYNIISNSGFRISLDSERLSSLLYEKRLLIRGPKIVAIGGGTGISTMLRGLKAFSSNITAVVTVADDGGGSGVLRQDLGMLPPGDIRNCILALADTEPIMERLLQYRFQDGMLKGQSFGNLFLAAMDGISDSFEEAVQKMSDVLAVTGKVLPVTLENVELCAQLEDGFIVRGESNIGKHNEIHEGRIKRVFIEPADVKPLSEVIDAIIEADIVVLGPGSLYTSIIPNLLIEGISDALKKTHGLKVYVCNVMTQPGETEDFKVSDHIKAIEEHSFKGVVDYCIVNTAIIPENLKNKYHVDRAQAVLVDYNVLEDMGINILGGAFISSNSNLIRHDTEKLAKRIVELVAEKILLNNKKRTIDYYYVRDRLKKV